MTDSTKDTGIIQVLLQRFETQRLPRALAMKQKVDRGEPLEDFDIAYLKEIIDDIDKIKPLLDRHPEYTKLIAGAFDLYREITEKALDNEQK